MVPYIYEASRALLLFALVMLFGITNAQDVTLRFDQQYYISHQSIISAYCDSSLAPNWTYVAQFQFEDVNQSSSYRLSRDCTTGVTTVLNNTFYRMNQLSNEVGVFWGPLRRQNGGSPAYLCAIATCRSSALVVSSNTANFTVVPQPSIPYIDVNPRFVTENMTNTIELTCDGLVGQPGGEMTLLRHSLDKTVSPNRNITTVLATFEPDYNGHVEGRQNFTGVWTRDDDISTIAFSCTASNKLFNGSMVHESYYLSVDVQFPPSKLIVLSSEGELQRESETKYLIEGKASGAFSVAFTVEAENSYPLTRTLCTLRDGLPQYFKISSNGSLVTVNIVYTALDTAIFDVLCTGYYSSYSRDKTEVYSLVRVAAASGSRSIPAGVIILVALYFIRIFS